MENLKWRTRGEGDSFTCLHKHCDKVATKVHNANIYGLPVTLSFCEEHKERIESTIKGSGVK